MFYGKRLKIRTAKRLKELRTNYNNGNGISHEKLAAELNKRYSKLENERKNNYLGSLRGEIISAGVLKNYEITDVNHSKFNAGYGMNISYLTMLADFYNVTTDYLLGLSDDPQREPSAVDKLGLSPKARDIIERDHNTPSISKLISDLIEQNNFFYFQFYLGLALESSNAGINYEENVFKKYEREAPQNGVVILRPEVAVAYFIREAERYILDCVGKTADRLLAEQKNILDSLVDIDDF